MPPDLSSLLGLLGNRSCRAFTVLDVILFHSFLSLLLIISVMDLRSDI